MNTSRRLNTDEDSIENKRLIASSIRTGATMLWPFVLTALVPKSDRNNPALLFPIVWSFLIWLLDSHLLYRGKSAVKGRLATLRMDPASVTSLSFGLSALIGARAESQYVYLFLIAIVGCMAIVSPSHTLEPGCFEEQLFESVQKAALIWCIGILITGVVLTRNGTYSGN